MVASGLAIALAFLGGPQDPALKTALKRFHEDFARAKSDVDLKNAAVLALAAHPHESVVDVLGPLLAREKSAVVRIKIAQELGRFAGVDGAGPALLRALRSGTNNSGANKDAVRIVLLRGLGELKCVEAVRDVNRMVDDRALWVAKAAIVAAGRLGQRSSVDPLLRALRRVEGPAGNGLADLNPLKELREIVPLEPEERPENVREALREPLLQSLKSLTGKAYTRAEQYEAWLKGRKVPASDE